MGKFEDHYRRQASETTARYQQHNVTQYNYWVNAINKIVPELIAAAECHPPARCSWVPYNGHNCASWELLRDYEGMVSINLLSIGRLVRVDGDLGHPTRVCDYPLRTVSSYQEMQRRGYPGYNSVDDLYKAILSTGMPMFGLTASRELWMHERRLWKLEP